MSVTTTTAFCMPIRSGPAAPTIYPPATGVHHHHHHHHQHHHHQVARAGTLTLVAAPLANAIHTSDRSAKAASGRAISRPIRRLPVFAHITEEEHRRQSQLLLAQTLLEEFHWLLAELKTARSRYWEQLAMLEKQRISPFRLQNAEGLVVNQKTTNYAFETITMADQLIAHIHTRQSTLKRCIAAAGRLEIGRWIEDMDRVLHSARHLLHTRHWSVPADATRVIIKTANGTCHAPSH
ncbi:hypothetical protein SYNPS1DRAFT_27894 [Syncephalis pseudoplumigaleata]|uniref:Uncharacterized protein n=1 Tax=Syncephalis pseudoplumigaleata TaxID=1712513 RepID=A0A4P9Z1U1_9FUNG|nr:hypothetical protein SYNPS1DRAFT_27894 [Syncephalis pseudoplumigaleata]|eukprot:RKP26414.1 hypothetical protein SYNPS1DRAFT_27894 [Syncephalis pseudoplumigaleata]